MIMISSPRELECYVWNQLGVYDIDSVEDHIKIAREEVINGILRGDYDASVSAIYDYFGLEPDQITFYALFC